MRRHDSNALLWWGIIGALLAAFAIANAGIDLRRDRTVIRSFTEKLATAQYLYSEADRERDDLLLYKRRREAEDARVKKLLDSGRFLPLPLPR
jgi:hypothetical protein